MGDTVPGDTDSDTVPGDTVSDGEVPDGAMESDSGRNKQQKQSVFANHKPCHLKVALDKRSHDLNCSSAHPVSVVISQQLVILFMQSLLCQGSAHGELSVKRWLDNTNKNNYFK